MAAIFTAASTQYLTNSAPPITGYPATVGCWVYLAALGVVNRTIWSVSDTATTNNFYRLVMSSGEVLRAGAAAGGTEVNAALTTALVVDSWHFVVARFISSTNRKIAGLFPTGAIEHGTIATARAPTGLDTMGIGILSTSAGATEPWSGGIGELWYTNTDIQSDGAQLLDSTLRQLAYGGPFSVPHIAKDIIEYRSFLKYPSSEGDDPSEVFHGALGRQTWTNTNGVTTGRHPPLPYWYVKPGQVIRNLTI